MKNKATTIALICLIVAAIAIGLLSNFSSWETFRHAFFDEPDPEPIETNSIKLAVLEPQTGDLAAEAEDEINGIILANEVYGKVMGKPVELVFYDTESTAEKTKEKAEEIAESDVVAVIGTYGNLMSLAAGDIFREKEIPAVAATCSNSLVTQQNPYYVSVNCPDPYESNCAAEFAYKYLHAKKPATVYIAGSDYAKAKADGFAEKFLELSKLKDISSVAIPKDTTDYNEFLETLEREDIDTVYLPERADRAEAIIKAARELGFEFNWIGPSDWETMETKSVYYTVKFDPKKEMSEVSELFLKAYHEKYGDDSEPSEAFALGFDAYLITLVGIRDSSTPMIKSRVAAALKEIKTLPAATGVLTIGENGNAVKTVYIYSLTEDGASEVFSSIPTTKGKESQ